MKVHNKAQLFDLKQLGILGMKREKRVTRILLESHKKNAKSSVRKVLH